MAHNLKAGDKVLVDGNGLYAHCTITAVPTEGIRAVCEHVIVAFTDTDMDIDTKFGRRQFWVEAKNCKIVEA